MKKIMHVAFQAQGGVETYLQSFFKYSNTKECVNFFLCSSDFDINMYNALTNKCVHVCNAKDGFIKKYVAVFFNIRKQIKLLSPDIVYFHSSKAGAVGRIAAIGLPVKVVYNAHGWAFNQVLWKVMKIAYLWAEKVLARFTHEIVVISNYEKECAIKNKVCKSKKLTVILNGIDIEKIENDLKNAISRQSLCIPSDAYVIGCVARLTKQKGPDKFVEMAKEVKKVIENAYFLWVGDGEERKKVEQNIQNSGLCDCFKITGWTDKPCVYANLFDQAVCLSRWEGFGLVLAEYMILSKPIIATNVNAIPEVICGFGVLVDVDDVDKTVCEVIINYNDEKLRYKTVKNGSERARELFNVKRTVKESELLFERVLS